MENIAAYKFYCCFMHREGDDNFVNEQDDDRAVVAQQFCSDSGT